MMRPFVSVLVDTYNHERFIEEALVSVLEQDFSPHDREILVVDDGSTDRTPEIVRKFEPAVRLIRKQNGGQASAFNVGIPECQGEAIAFLDGDDWWLPNKLRCVAEVLEAEREVGLVGHGYNEVLENGTERVVAPSKAERLKIDSLSAAQVFRLRKAYLGTSRMTLRGILARQILPIPEALVFEADEYLFTLAASIREIVILQAPQTCYRIHGNNLYVAPAGGAVGLRRKQQVMAALANLLERQLLTRGVPADAVACVVEIIQAEADQMRLLLDGGRRREAMRTEKLIYEAMHADAPLAHRVSRKAIILLAMILPPRWYYTFRRWLTSHAWYRAVRKKVVPVPALTHVEAHEYRVSEFTSREARSGAKSERP